MRDRVGLNSTYLSLLTSLRTQAHSRDAQDALRGRADPWQARAGHDRQAADAPKAGRRCGRRRRRARRLPESMCAFSVWLEQRVPTAYAHAQRHDAAGSRRALVSSLSAAALRTRLRGCTALESRASRAGDRGRGFAAHLSVLRRIGGDFASRDANATPRTPRAKHTVRAAAFGAGRQISDAPCSRHTARWLSCREWRVSAGTTGHGIRVRLLRECIRAAATRALASLLPFGVCSACCWRKARAHTLQPMHMMARARHACARI